MVEETKYLGKKPHVEVSQIKQWCVEFSTHKKVNAVIQRQPAMLWQNHKSLCILCQNGAWKIPQTLWRWKGPGAPWRSECRLWTAEPRSAPPGMRNIPTSIAPGAQCSHTLNLAAGHMYAFTAVTWTGIFQHDEDTKSNTMFAPQMLTDEWTYTGQYTMDCVVMQLASIWKTGAANWTILRWTISIDWMTWNFADYTYIYVLLKHNVVIKNKVNKNPTWAGC
jgi:hypothetical protein